MTKCSTCNATYPATQPDGTRYFHSCAPLSDAEVAISLGFGGDASKWTVANLTAIAAASRVRPNARNENVPDAATLKALVAGVLAPEPTAYWKQVNAIAEAAIAAPGAGTTLTVDAGQAQPSAN